MDWGEIVKGIVLVLLILFVAFSSWLPAPFNFIPRDVSGWLFIGVGVFFLLLGSLGLLRMPDLYSRMQTATKVTTLGALSTLVGVSILDGRIQFVLKAMLIGLFLLLTAPISASVLIRGAHDRGVPVAEETKVDMYQEDKEGDAS